MTVNFIRVCGAFMIFLCHACNESGNALLGIFSQFFNVGVPIFFMLAGYLYSTKKPPNSVLKWYLRRIKRLIIPLYIFLAMLMAAYWISGRSIHTAVWIQSILPVCGLTQKYISGCGHLWFITHLLICYLTVPLLQRWRTTFVKAASIWCGTVIWGGLAVLLAYTVEPIWCTLLNSFFDFWVGFCLLPIVLQKRRHFLKPVIFAIGSCSLRVFFRFTLDDTPLYNSVLTQITSLILAVAIIDFLFGVGTYWKEHGGSVVEKTMAILSSHTYEFYLVHYVFLNGTFKLHVFEYYILNVVTAFFFSIIAAIIIHFLSEILQGNIQKGVKKCL